jgi:small subunit ribosomal protein S6
VSPDATDAQIADLHAQVEAIVQRFDAQIEKTENWGRRRLAYEIGPHKEGTYVLELIEGGGDVMKEIDRRLMSATSSSGTWSSAWTPSRS